MTESQPPIPKFELHSLLLYVLENLAVIKRHLLLFVVLIAAAGVIAGYAVRQIDTRQIDILTANNTQLRDDNSSLRQSAVASPPSQWRRLSDAERASLIQSLKAWSGKPTTINVFAMAESESRQYGGQLLDVLRAAGIEPKENEVPLSMGFGGPIETGLMIGVINFADPPSEAREFLQIFKDAGLSVHFTQWTGAPTEKPSYDLFVGPKPW